MNIRKYMFRIVYYEINFFVLSRLTIHFFVFFFVVLFDYFLFSFDICFPCSFSFCGNRAGNDIGIDVLLYFDISKSYCKIRYFYFENAL